MLTVLQLSTQSHVSPRVGYYIKRAMRAEAFMSAVAEPSLCSTAEKKPQFYTGSAQHIRSEHHDTYCSCSESKIREDPSLKHFYTNDVFYPEKLMTTMCILIGG